MSFTELSASNFGGIGDVYHQDGYKLIRAEQLVAALAALNTGAITFRALRTYLGCFELLAIREAAERSTTKLRKKPLRPEADVSVSRELSQLKRAELLSFSEAAITVSDSPTHGAELYSLLGGRGAQRLIPVPRRVLRFLAGCSKPALVKTIIANKQKGTAPRNGIVGMNIAKLGNHVFCNQIGV